MEKKEEDEEEEKSAEGVIQKVTNIHTNTGMETVEGGN